MKKMLLLIMVVSALVIGCSPQQPKTVENLQVVRDVRTKEDLVEREKEIKYEDKINSLRDNFNDTLTTFVKTINEGIENGRLVFNDDWRNSLTIMSLSFGLVNSEVKVISINSGVPTKYSEAHTLFQEACDLMYEASKLYVKGIEELDKRVIQQAEDKMYQSWSKIEEFNEKNKEINKD